jgi:hypothetical protein
MLEHYIPRLVNPPLSLRPRLPRRPLKPSFARYPVSQQSMEHLRPTPVQLALPSVERVVALLLVVFSLLSSVARVFYSLSFTSWLVLCSRSSALLFLTISSEEVSP